MLIGLAFPLRKRAETGRRQAVHGLSSKAGRTVGGQGYCSQVNKSSPTPHEENQYRRRGRARQNVLSRINPSKSYKGLNKALCLPRPCLSAYQPFKAVSGCTGEQCSSRLSTCVTFRAGFPEISVLSGKMFGSFFHWCCPQMFMAS